jgi:gliding motility-associated-like protein
MRAQQNIVPNPSFEDYTSCPLEQSFSTDELSKAYPWYSGGGTCDFFHVCNNGINGSVGVPSSSFGYQSAFQGNGYAGFGAHDYSVDWREYIQAKLLEPLQPCGTYEVSFYVSLCDRSAYALSQIGAYFSDAPVSGPAFSPLLYPAQVKNPIGQYLTDTTGWMKITGQFIARGGEEFITIGYFEPSVQNETLYIQPFQTSTPITYYFVDSVSVRQIRASECIPNVFTPNADGANDVVIFGMGHINSPALEIYNRWGVLIVRSTDRYFEWNGTNANGNTCTAGVYYYVITGRDENNRNYLKKGFVHLLR